MVTPGPAVKFTVLLPMASVIVAVSLSIASAKTASSGYAALRGRVPVLHLMALGHARYQKTTSSFYTIKGNQDYQIEEQFSKRLTVIVGAEPVLNHEI